MKLIICPADGRSAYISRIRPNGSADLLVDTEYRVCTFLHVRPDFVETYFLSALYRLFEIPGRRVPNRTSYYNYTSVLRF